MNIINFNDKLEKKIIWTNLNVNEYISFFFSTNNLINSNIPYLKTQWIYSNNNITNNEPNNLHQIYYDKFDLLIDYITKLILNIASGLFGVDNQIIQNEKTYKNLAFLVKIIFIYAIFYSIVKIIKLLFVVFFICYLIYLTFTFLK